MSEANIPLYQTIYNDLAEKIKNGFYKSGDKLPSEKELADEYNVSRITSKKALEMLADEGLIIRAPGRGSFVKDDQAADDSRISTNNKYTLIGVILPDFSEAYGTGLLLGIEKQAFDENCFIVVKRSYGRQDIEEEIIDSMLKLGVDGIIIMPVHGELYNRKILQLTLDGFPIVSVDRCLSGIHVSFVGTDNVTASEKAIDYLFSLGHRNIAIMCPPYKNTSTIEERIEGYIKSYAKHGVGLDETIWLTNLTSTIPSQNSKENRKKDIDKIVDFLQKNPDVTCIYALEYNIALIAMKAAKLIGKSIPQDLSILCFDSPQNYADEYVFTFVRQKEAEMGQIALKLVLKQMKEGKKKVEKIYLDTELVIGATTAKNIRSKTKI